MVFVFKGALVSILVILVHTVHFASFFCLCFWTHDDVMVWIVALFRLSISAVRPLPVGRCFGSHYFGCTHLFLILLIQLQYLRTSGASHSPLDRLLSTVVIRPTFTLSHRVSHAYLFFLLFQEILSVSQRASASSLPVSSFRLTIPALPVWVTCTLTHWLFRIPNIFREVAPVSFIIDFGLVCDYCCEIYLQFGSVSAWLFWPGSWSVNVWESHGGWSQVSREDRLYGVWVLHIACVYYSCCWVLSE